MSVIKIDFLRRFAQGGAITALGAVGSSAWAQQMCSYDISTVPGPIPANVPSLSILGVALLAAAIAFMAWRMGKFPGARLMAIALVAAAAMLANQGGGGLVQKAYAATLEIFLSNPAGGNTGVVIANGDEMKLINNSGVPLRITGIEPATDACGEGTILPVGGSCTTVASCAVVSCEPGFSLIDGVCVPDEPEPAACGINEVENPLYPTPPNWQCICREGYARNLTSGVCQVARVCSGTITVEPTGDTVCQPD